MNDATGLDHFKRELLRWNESINLVSRHDTEARIESLVAQCRDAFLAWTLDEGPLGLEYFGRDVLYVDIGSGGGFPSVVWHEMLARQTMRLRTVLVEPREKRAWFLERVARELAPPPPEVLTSRWDEARPPEPVDCDLVLVSLKALRLGDMEILTNLEPPFGTKARAGICIARFYPANTAWSEDLQTSLSILPPGGSIRSDFRTGDRAGFREIESVAAGVLPAGGASLVISRYELRAGPLP